MWDFAKPQKSELHPTMRPVEMYERALQNHSHTGDLVLELFGGSGTTMIAAERLGRRSVLMEIDPRYVDVIRQRYAEFTELKPRRMTPVTSPEGSHPSGDSLSLHSRLQRWRSQTRLGWLLPWTVGGVDPGLGVGSPAPIGALLVRSREKPLHVRSIRRTT